MFDHHQPAVSGHKLPHNEGSIRYRIHRHVFLWILNLNVNPGVKPEQSLRLNRRRLWRDIRSETFLGNSCGKIFGWKKDRTSARILSETNGLKKLFKNFIFKLRVFCENVKYRRDRKSVV